MTENFEEWRNRNFTVPPPMEIKREVLTRYNTSNTTWVETGTYHGETTLALSKVSQQVYSIEPCPVMYKNVYDRFSNIDNIILFNDLSENILPVLLPTLSGDLCFWLDGHYSGNETFKGPNDTPLLYELDSIEKNLNCFSECTVLIDDIRFCGKDHQYGNYPSLDYLVDWSRKNKLEWHIQYDIFVATTIKNLYYQFPRG